MSVSTGTPPLKGIRILDLSRVLAGPFCSMILSDLGAEVIKVEIPGGGDDTRKYPPFIEGESSYFMSVNRGKKSITLNLKTKEARQVIYKLVRECDVFLENFRPSVTERIGVDYKTLKEHNPGLIYCSISSFGQTGPYALWPGYDLIIQGMSGLMGITGERGRPPVRVGIAVTDLNAGMYATIAILAALRAKEQTGSGQYIDVSMMDASISWMTYIAGNFFATNKVPLRMGSAHPNIVPYQAFETSDNKFILIAAGNDRLFRVMCNVMGIESLAEHPKFAVNDNRVSNREQLVSILESKFMKRTRKEWLDLFRKAGFPCAPVYTIEEVFHDKQTLHRDMIIEMEHPKIGKIRQIGTAIKLSNTPCTLSSPPPILGEHTEEILGKLGYTFEEIAKLREAEAL